MNPSPKIGDETSPSLPDTAKIKTSPGILLNQKEELSSGL